MSHLSPQRPSPSPLYQGLRRRQNRRMLVLLILMIGTLVLCATALMLGEKRYSLEVIVRVLSGEQIQGATFAIHTLRLPRMLAGLLVGFAFGMAGSTFQTMLRNPLASPDIIGVTSGSSIAAVFCMLVLHLSGPIVSVAAILSGLAVAALIYLLSRGGSFSGGRLVLIGIGIQSMISAMISYLMLRANQYDVPGAMRWLSGSLNGIRLAQIPLLLIVVALGSLLLVLFARYLKILELGEASAITLGVRTDGIRLLLVLSAVALIAFATAVTGPVAFVSFLAGPIAARLVGHGQDALIPSGLVGALLVLLADLLGQYAFGTRFPVGVVTGILGAPYLLYLLIRMNRIGGAA